MIGIDTLQISQELRNAGFPQEQADELPRIFARMIVGGAATKDDLNEVRSDLKEDIMELRKEMTALEVRLIRWIMASQVATISILSGIIFSVLQ